MGNVFENVIKLKNQFSQIASDNLDGLNQLFAGEITSSNLRLKVSDDFSMLLDDQTQSIKIFDNNADLLDQLSIDELSDSYDHVIEEASGYTIGDCIQQIGYTGNLYDQFSVVTSKFAYLNRQSFSDVQSALSLGSISNRPALLKLLSSCTNAEGYITITAWMSLLDNWFRSVNDKLDDDSVELDDSNPYKNADIIGVLFEAVSAITDVLIFVLSGIFRAIAACVSVVIKMVSLLLNSVKAKESTQINYDCNNLFVAGPVLSFESTTPLNGWNASSGGQCNIIPFSDDPHYQPYYPKDRSIYYSGQNGIGYFSWYNTDFSATRTCAYMYPYFDVRRINFQQLFDLEVYGANRKVHFNSNVMDPDHPYYIPVDSNFTGWPHYDDDHQPNDVRDVIFSLALGCLIRNMSLLKQDTPSQVTACWIMTHHNDLRNISVLGWQYFDDATLDGIPAHSRFLPRLYDLIACITANSSDGYISGAESFYANWDNAYALFTDFIADQMTVYFKDYVIPNNATPVYAATLPISFVNNTGMFMFPCVFPLAGTANFRYEVDAFDQKVINFYSMYRSAVRSYQPDIIECNCLPGSFGITFPTLLSNTVVELLAMTAMAVSAIAIIGTVAKIYISKMMIAKRAIQGDEIAKKREEFIQDPENQEKRKDYVNTVFKFNLFGNIFGYGSYDGRNGWFDSASGSSDMGSSITNSLYEGNTKAMADSQSDILTAVNNVKNLINHD